MNDEDVETLTAWLKSGTRLVWMQLGVAKELSVVVPNIPSDNEEVNEPGPCALLKEGGWIALDNVDASSIYVIKPLFE